MALTLFFLCPICKGPGCDACLGKGEIYFYDADEFGLSKHLMKHRQKR